MNAKPRLSKQFITEIRVAISADLHNTANFSDVTYQIFSPNQSLDESFPPFSTPSFNVVALVYSFTSQQTSRPIARSSGVPIHVYVYFLPIFIKCSLSCLCSLLAIFLFPLFVSSLMFHSPPPEFSSSIIRFSLATRLISLPIQPACKHAASGQLPIPPPPRPSCPLPVNILYIQVTYRYSFTCMCRELFCILQQEGLMEHLQFDKRAQLYEQVHGQTDIQAHTQLTHTN